MELFNLFYGLFMIALGFLVKAAPNLISGYNTMPEEQKKNVDIKGLSTYLRNGFIVIGLTIIIGFYFFKWIGITLLSNSITVIATLLGVTVMVINSQKFDHNKNKKNWLTHLILGLVCIFVIGIIVYGFIPAKVSVNNDTLSFSGMYGFDIGVSDIKDIELAESIPAIKLRTNGFSLGNINKGYFKLERYGNTHLLLHSNKSPFLVITKTNNEKIIINYSEQAKTQEVYSTINRLIKK